MSAVEVGLLFPELLLLLPHLLRDSRHKRDVVHPSVERRRPDDILALADASHWTRGTRETRETRNHEAERLARVVSKTPRLQVATATSHTPLRSRGNATLPAIPFTGGLRSCAATMANASHWTRGTRGTRETGNHEVERLLSVLFPVPQAALG